MYDLVEKVILPPPVTDKLEMFTRGVSSATVTTTLVSITTSAVASKGGGAVD